MSIRKRVVKNKKDENGNPTFQKGTVYDVFMKYKDEDGAYTNYVKRGFLKEQDAALHEMEMKVKFANGTAQLKRNNTKSMSVRDYLAMWLQDYAKDNIRPSSFRGYETNIRKHVLPYIGDMSIQKVSQHDLDRLYKKLLKNLSMNTVKYVHRTLSIALTHAESYYECIDSNPAKKIMTKFKHEVSTPSPYTIKEINQLMNYVMGDNLWEFAIMCASYYGLRRNEIFGMQITPEVELLKVLPIHQQLSPEFKAKSKCTFSEVKETSSYRDLPITNETKIYVERQLNRVREYKKNNPDFEDNGLLICMPSGRPYDPRNISSKFKKLLEVRGFREQRLHDLRHATATNIHGLTGDFFTVSKILGHSMKGISETLNIATAKNATHGYVDVRTETIKNALSRYHKELVKPDKN